MDQIGFVRLIALIWVMKAENVQKDLWRHDDAAATLKVHQRHFKGSFVDKNSGGLICY